MNIYSLHIKYPIIIYIEGHKSKNEIICCKGLNDVNIYTVYLMKNMLNWEIW